MSNSCCPDEFIGAEPAIVKWRAVRGDTASIMVQFLQSDETTAYDTAGWTYIATAYEERVDQSHTLDIQVNSGYIKIIANAEITSQWAIGLKTGELSFDVQVTIDGDTVWTPIIGTINVIGDVTGAQYGNSWQ